MPASSRKATVGGRRVSDERHSASEPAEPGAASLAPPARPGLLEAASSGESDEENATPSAAGSSKLALSVPRRKGGLSEVERKCFRRALVLSPRGQEKLSDMRQQSEIGVEAVSESPGSEVPFGLSPRAANRRKGGGMSMFAVRSMSTLPEMPFENNGLDDEAEQVAQVLGRIFPSTREVAPPKAVEMNKYARLAPMYADQQPQPAMISRNKSSKTLHNGLIPTSTTPSTLSVSPPPRGTLTAAAAGKGHQHVEKGRTSKLVQSGGGTASEKSRTSKLVQSGGGTASEKATKSTGAASASGATKSTGAASATSRGGKDKEAAKDAENAGEDSEVPAIEKSRLRRSLQLLRRENRLGVDDGTDLPLSQMMKEVDPASRPLFENAVLMTKVSAAGGLKRSTTQSGYSFRVEVPKAAERSFGTLKARPTGLKALQKVTRKVELMNSLGGGMMMSDENFSLREFRRRLLHRFGSVHEAFNHVDMDASEELDLNEWEKAMVTAEVCNQREAHLMFELLDASNDGLVSMLEFQVGIETISPVNNLESFRKRLLCLGFRTMIQAIKVMEGACGEGTMRQQLQFHEFANALRRVYIFDPTEAHVLFEAIRDPTDEFGRISIGDVAAALGMVSPSFLLEELRERVLTRNSRGQEIWKSIFTWSVRGNEHLEVPADLHPLLDRWWTAKRYKDVGLADTLLAELRAKGVDVDTLRPPGTEVGEFVSSTVEQLGLTPAQATKSFRLVDIDGNGDLEINELLSAMNLAMPCVISEQIRHVVRQRHRSIYAALAAASEMQLAGGTSVRTKSLDDEVKFTSAELGIFLESLEMNPKDVQRLFHLIDARGDGSLTLSQFFKGIRIFAPTCILEGIRLQLLANYGRVADAFYSDVHQERTEPLEIRDVADLLLRLGVHMESVDMEAVFDCLDARNVGTVTVTEMVAAFQNLSPGSGERTNSNECERKAERSVRAELAGIRKNVSELRSNVRQALDDEPAAKVAKRPTIKAGASSDGQSASMPRLARIPPDELAKVQYEARKMLGKVVSAPELRRSPREQESAAPSPGDEKKGQKLELPQLEQGRRASSKGTGAGAQWAPNAAGKPGGQGRAAFTTAAFDRIRSNLKTLPPHQMQRAQLNFEPLSGYFTSASETLEEHLPLFEVRRKRRELHSEIARHVTLARLKVN